MTQRTRVIVDQTALALRIGARIRSARLAAGLTQQQLASGRYTKAYISALEQGHAKPSMAALDFIAERLGLPASTFLGRDDRWGRMEADLLLASGEWQEASLAYRDLLDAARDRGIRAELLCGLSEALCRLEQGRDALAPADEALTLFRALGRQADSLMAGYWLAYARYQTGDTHGARALLARMLADLDVPSTQAPADLRIRVLIALGSVATDQGDHAHAVGWLDEARTLSDGLDDRRRASLLSMIATSRAATGDVDGAVRAGVESLALYRSVEARHEAAVIENNLALAWLQAGDVERAREYAACARRRHEVEGDHVSLAHVIETEARIALLDQQPEDALRLAAEAERLARTSGNGRALTSSLVTSAQALVALERPVDAVTAYQEAIESLRTNGSGPALRAALTGLADLMATLGRHREAFELTREALSTTMPSGARPGTTESARPAPQVASPASA